MKKSLIEYVISIEEKDDLHIIRLIVLLQALTGKKQNFSIEISELAKLDFFLRYPIALQKALSILKTSKMIEISETEKNNIEVKTLYFHYSPWNIKFRKLLKVMAARLLISWNLKGRKVEVELTTHAYSALSEITDLEIFENLRSQSKLIKTHLSTLSQVKINSLINEILVETTFANLGERL